MKASSSAVAIFIASLVASLDGNPLHTVEGKTVTVTTHDHGFAGKNNKKNYKKNANTMMMMPHETQNTHPALKGPRLDLKDIALMMKDDAPGGGANDDDDDAVFSPKSGESVDRSKLDKPPVREVDFDQASFDPTSFDGYTSNQTEGGQDDEIKSNHVSSTDAGKFVHSPPTVFDGDGKTSAAVRPAVTGMATTANDQLDLDASGGNIMTGAKSPLRGGTMSSKKHRDVLGDAHDNVGEIMPDATSKTGTSPAVPDPIRIFDKDAGYEVNLIHESTSVVPESATTSGDVLEEMSSGDNVLGDEQTTFSRALKGATGGRDPPHNKSDSEDSLQSAGEHNLLSSEEVEFHSSFSDGSTLKQGEGRDDESSSVTTAMIKRNLDLIGTAYFNFIESNFEPPSDEPLYGSSVSISEDGDTIAIASDSFVQIREKPLGGGTFDYTITTNITYDEIISESADAMDVALSGDGNYLAIAALSTEKSGVLIYKRTNTDGSDIDTWNPVGDVIDAGSLGDYTGLKVSLSKNAEVLAIGGRNYDTDSNNDVGRVRVYRLDNDDADDANWKYTVVYDSEGVSEGEALGSSVSLTSDGEYLAVGLTGYDGTNNNAGAVRVLRIDSEVVIGDVIEGDGKDDVFGFSVKLAKIGDKVLQVAAGAIYNDPISGLRDAGHVRVFRHDGSSSWTQRGKDIDGDTGVTIDLETGDFHIGDSLGFSLGMSTNGDRVAVSAPFHGNKREREYYQGKIKLFEFDSVANDWVQIADSIMGTSGDDNAGYSIALSGNGKLILIGSPGPVKGKATLVHQDEISNAPSMIPTQQPSLSLAPSTAPSISLMPSSQPSASSSPSAKPSAFKDRTFLIRTTFYKYDNLLGDDTFWCLQAQNAAKDSDLFISPCDGTDLKQRWFFDRENNKIALRERPAFCISKEGKQVKLIGCTDVVNNFIIDEGEGSIYVANENDKKFYFGVDTIKIFSKVRLFKSGSENSSWNAWRIMYEGLSDAPSLSAVPSQAPSAICSLNDNNTNVALGQPASQSSAYKSNQTASVAVNGEKRSEDELGVEQGLSFTKKEFEPWWKVTLDSKYVITDIIIYNRHPRWGQRLQGFHVEIFNGDDENAVWMYNDSTPTGQNPGSEIPLTIPDCGIVGDMVKISIPGRNEYLQLREVEVFGRLDTPETGYDLVYSLEIPVSPNYRDSPPLYSVDNHLEVTSFSRVAYYLRLDDDYVWVSMDTFTSDSRKIGVPCLSLECGDGIAPTVFQELLTNVNVVSNVEGLSGSGLSGNIEFWPYGYGPGNAIGINGASDSDFDFGDGHLYGGDYGSMQIHIHGGGDYVGTVFAFNFFHGHEKYDADIGIGNRPTGQPDWTFAYNANTYSVRNLKVYTSSE